MNLACSGFRSLSRRSLLKAGSAGVAGLTLPSLLRAEAKANSSSLKPKAKHVIFLHQFGGPSHLDTFDMKPGAPDGIRGEFKPIQSHTPGLYLTEHLPRFSRVLGEFAQIRSVHHRMKNHNSATYYSLTGHAPPVDDIRLRDTLELYPSYGSTVSRFRPVDDAAIPSHVAFPYVLSDGSITPGQTASFLGKIFDPFLVNRDPSQTEFKLPELSLPSSLTLGRLNDRQQLLQLIDQQAAMADWSDSAQGIDEFYHRALTMLQSPKVRSAFDLSEESDNLRDAYGRTPYGQSCLLARRLVESGVRFVTVYYSKSIGGMEDGGWDTHGENFRTLKNRLLPITDQTLPTFIDDMKARGLLDETLIVWMGEFGRSPRVANTKQFGPNGRDHWPYCYTALMAGGGITPGAIHGASDRIGAYPSTDGVSPDDIAATMFWALGIDPALEFTDTLNRPLRIATGEPITSIFS